MFKSSMGQTQDFGDAGWQWYRVCNGTKLLNKEVKEEEEKKLGSHSALQGHIPRELSTIPLPKVYTFPNRTYTFI